MVDIETGVLGGALPKFWFESGVLGGVFSDSKSLSLSARARRGLMTGEVIASKDCVRVRLEAERENPTGELGKLGPAELEEMKLAFGVGFGVGVLESL